MTCLSILLSFVMIYLDRNFMQDGLLYIEWIYPNDPDGARTFLSTVAGSMITIAGVVFSITIVALTLASSQFGPRILINFMRDKGNQIVLGTFISTFVYCLLVLRTIKGGNENYFIPNLSVSLAGVLTLLSIGVLIYFIHHAASSIHVSNVLTNISRDLEYTINRIFPNKKTDKELIKDMNWWLASHDMPIDYLEKKQIVQSAKSGYLQAVDYEGLFNISTDNQLIIDLKNSPGDFIVKGQIIAEVYITNQDYDTLLQLILNSFIIGQRRTDEQDLKFVINQLVEISVRSLSPGINDPFTANMCIDRLALALCLLAKRQFPSSKKYDKNNNLRLIINTITFNELLDSAFNDIRNYSGSSLSVSKHILEALRTIKLHTKNIKDKEAILHHAVLVRDNCKVKFIHQSDIDDIDRLYSEIEGIAS